ncbi:hypothetical protein PHYBLDRAFT_166938 [Phycomyces blakesleeanus NRRL 1555(-)]|uniref:SWIM-type domain-containing protein n=1 Tax=Phycomyces blakesleeanus (strain ATCC 8743b / DSM 1359 / FGSC 10004 / NBRC 33097 / NRRL 1555) TaxID=763407 RepID=A0A162UH61_PHYB8|nr:hypothetical protein PHYBLDRAFT_167501 [Phycomyces blakesleeanus NRRL 1555(-)]XP_018293750.1 hypothetical protein PHYBLDRAFT_166938 [Phycomyces blakesleeanus NRRL 1555(-)]OAD75183.1 hypothetical protein PHYBLDRAFT_167501 [Phycomyces blakesleeanus NRRL 1555(-)]OAD75710.1 hypothetical protein PHYBLDRAFT_166938 [Phycomyces blakesleeanus NRRL 1555(-)]|eukprot:XP_018293223.1 hypothetical protein PHYBLDRAFT_167501 [Phycomyces blakesleeanus NRRL 1555(-)]
MSNNNINNTIYDISTIQQVLINSPLEGIKMLPLNSTILVKASEWEKCLERINVLCSTKWNKKHKYSGKGLVFGETKKCHRAGQYITNRQLRLAQKDTKACSCTAALKIIQHLDNPNVVTFCQTRAHVNHVPGDWDEVRTLPLPSEAIKIIEDQLKSGSSCRSTRISVLRQIDSWGVGVRKPNYEEIYNRMRKMTTLLYMFASDENASISIWLNVKLAEQNYCIFEINLSVYNDGKKQFAFGFQSPMQVSIMRISQSFCLDATHSISSRSDEVLYTLVTRHPQTGKGFPVAYMVTNNQTAIPIKLWLDHLRIKSSFVPMNITIDCSIMEVNAIKEALPHATIHYCDFHVLRAWQHNLDSKIKLNASYTSEQLGNYKTALKNYLRHILIESNEDVFLRAIEDFKLMVQDQPQFLKYFEKKWTENEELLRRWGRPYISQQHQRYVTNNYVESWHNQLKTIYFGRARIRRLDRLIFILTNDVEFYFEQEVERIHFNNGKMGPIDNELARNSFVASKIQNDMLPSMILNPLGETGNSMDDYNGEWQIRSFVTEDKWYTVNISNDLIQSCTCPNFLTRQIPCKHSHLLKRYCGAKFSFIEQREIAGVVLNRQDAVNANENEVEEEVEEELESGGTAEDRGVYVFDEIAAYSATMHHGFEDLQTLKTIPGLDQTKADLIKRALADAVRLMDEYRSENPSYFRNLNTQR